MSRFKSIRQIAGIKEYQPDESGEMQVKLRRESPEDKIAPALKEKTIQDIKSGNQPGIVTPELEENSPEMEEILKRLRSR